jgi:tetratricopeptide (TPR) repeat protein
MQAAIMHNNKGVELMARGCHEIALIEFKKAAEMLYSFTQSLKDTSGPLDPESILLLHEGTSFTRFETTEMTLNIENSFLHLHPIIMISSNEPASACTLESASVLLNMALSYHVKSIQDIPSKDVVYNAIHLYEMAFSLASQGEDAFRSSEVILTSLNNMGMIRLELGEFEAARQCFNHLLSYGKLISRLNNLPYKDHLNVCMLNAIVLLEAHCCAGAA